jgi:hypothetical protein
VVSECLNPDCRRPLVYLRSGRVVRVTRGSDDDLHIEHFWLCGDCYLRFDFLFLPGGEVQVAARAILRDEQPSLNLALTA